MTENLIATELEKTVKELSNSKAIEFEYFPKHGKALPSIEKLKEIVDLLRTVLFPGFFGTSFLKPSTLSLYVGGNIEKLYEQLSEQIQCGICFDATSKECEGAKDLASELALVFIKKLPEIRRLLTTDIKAMYDGDPAAKNFGEIIFSYPFIRAITNHRCAHELIKLNVPMLPRMISEMAHSETGIDIHPGAQIGESFTIDHGTGVVIGETCIIGNNVRLYQGVTLGAKSFKTDENGAIIKNLPRHPIIENNVVIYSNATVLGRITVGAFSAIGGNVWVTNDVLPYSKVLQQKATSETFKDGGGI
jgi:serine O-acetyltransferase